MIIKVKSKNHEIVKAMSKHGEKNKYKEVNEKEIEYIPRDPHAKNSAVAQS